MTQVEQRYRAARMREPPDFNGHSKKRKSAANCAPGDSQGVKSLERVRAEPAVTPVPRFPGSPARTNKRIAPAAPTPTPPARPPKTARGQNAAPLAPKGQAASPPLPTQRPLPKASSVAPPPPHRPPARAAAPLPPMASSRRAPYSEERRETARQCAREGNGRWVEMMWIYSQGCAILFPKEIERQIGSWRSNGESGQNHYHHRLSGNRQEHGGISCCQGIGYG